VFGLKKRVLVTLTSLCLALSLVLMPSTSEAKSDSYKVQPGDTLWKIAAQYGLSLKEILSANPFLSDANRIYPYQLIIIPKKINIDVPSGTQTPAAPKAPTSQTPQTPEPQAPAQETNLSQWEQEVVNLVNQERAKAGLKPLTVDAKLTEAARAKSADMRDRNYFSHYSPTYGSPFEMMDSFNISYRTAGENIAAGQRSPQEVMNAWMNSEGHRQNILNPNYTRIGVGLVQGGSYGYYWTQLFAG
jgi:uncharacterized YkwD family protein